MSVLNLVRFLNKPKYFHFSNNFKKNAVIFSPSRKESSDVKETIVQSTASNPISFISDSPFCRVFEDLLVQSHDIFGLNWCSTLFLAAFSFRLLICFPIKIYQEHLLSKLVNIQPTINELVKAQIKSGVPNFLNEKNIKKKEVMIRNEIYRREGCLPQKIPIASFLQMPFWIYLTAAIRNITSGNFAHEVQMKEVFNESLLWLDSLAKSDPYFLIPFIYAVTAFSSIKYSTLSSVTNNNVNIMMKFRKYLTLTFVAVITILITKMPASISLFWIFSNTLSFAEIILLDSIRVRRFFKIPTTKLEHKNIYKFKYDLFLKQVNKFFIR